jgi:hydroxypyruvate isomerase
MPQFAANLTMLFNELPFLDRFAAAADAGFDAVEFMFPYDYEPAQIADTLAANGQRLVLHNLQAGDWAGGDRGIACQPGRAAEFRAGVELAVRYAQALNCPRLNCLAGIPAGDAAEARQMLVENLRYAAGALSDAGIELLLEPVNTRDVPGFFVNTVKQALSILDDVGSSAARLQFDIYHTQVMEGDIANKIEANFGRIGHVQLADNPGRHEPGTGEINYAYLFGQLDELGYGGWVGCEYRPRGATTAGLGWLTPYRREAARQAPRTIGAEGTNQ